MQKIDADNVNGVKVQGLRYFGFVLGFLLQNIEPLETLDIPWQPEPDSNRIDQCFIEASSLDLLVTRETAVLLTEVEEVESNFWIFVTAATSWWVVQPPILLQCLGFIRTKVPQSRMISMYFLNLSRSSFHLHSGRTWKTWLWLKLVLFFSVICKISFHASMEIENTEEVSMNSKRNRSRSVGTSSRMDSQCLDH